jgi:membrane-associated phospholipid phosphatase
VTNAQLPPTAGIRRAHAGGCDPARSAATPDRAALPTPLRRPAAWTAGLAALAVAALGMRYGGLTESSRADRALGSAVESWISAKERGFWLVQSLGDPLPVIVLAGSMAALALVASRRRLAVIAVLGPGVTGVATTGLKPVFDRTLAGEPAYPSGHTAGLTALAIVAALLLASLLRAGAVTRVLLTVITAVGAGTVMAIALTALEIHHPTDAIGGFGTAVAVVLGAAVAVDRLAERPPRRAGDQPGR